MRTVTLHARSFAFGEATLAASFGVVVFIALLPGFARMWQLMADEPWLSTLVVVSSVHLVASTLVAIRKGSFTREAFWTEMLLKALICLAYVCGFAIQRMWDTDPKALPEDSAFRSIGHAVSGSLITIELGRFGSVLRSANLFVWPLEAVMQFLGKTYAGELKRQEQRNRTQEAVVQAVRVERFAAREELARSGEIKSQPFVETVNPEMRKPPADTDNEPKEDQPL
jgi:hypothetical protein